MASIESWEEAPVSRRRRRPPIPVTLTLPAEAPTPDEIDAILMATDAIIGQAGRNGVSLILSSLRPETSSVGARSRDE
jgi:hypothetical protein